MYYIMLLKFSNKQIDYHFEYVYLSKQVNYKRYKLQIFRKPYNFTNPFKCSYHMHSKQIRQSTYKNVVGTE